MTGWSHAEAVMGTGARIVVRDATGPAAEAASAEAMAWLHRVDATFSTYRPDSEVSRIDSGLLDPADASAEASEVLARCERLRLATGGYFDARATGRLDPSGLVKGWAVERASQILSEHGCPDHLVECGGDVCVRSEPGRPAWQVGVVHPTRLDAYCAVVGLANGAVATSGTYERGWHVVDPHTGLPAAALAAVTVVGADLGTADAYATAALAMGTGAVAWLGGLHGWEWLVVDPAGTGWSSPGWGGLTDAGLPPTSRSQPAQPTVKCPCRLPASRPRRPGRRSPRGTGR